MTVPTPAGPPRPAATTPLSTAALVAAIVIVVLVLIRQAVAYFIPVIVAQAGLSYAAVSGFYLVAAIVDLLLGALAVVLGLVAASREPAGRLRAGIAVGAGAVTVLSALVGVVTPLASLAF